jgi:hypothetical protein
MEFIELGTDVLPQHLLNKANRELTGQIAHFEQQIDRSNATRTSMPTASSS